MASVGPFNPGVVVEGTGGNYGWTDENNGKLSDDVYAGVSAGATGTGQSNPLTFTDLGFTIPSNSAINGIVVEIEAHTYRDSVDDGFRVSATLVKNNAVTGTTKGPINLPTTTNTFTTFGNSTDLWGATLTAADVNSANFGVEIYVNNVNTSSTGSLDSIRMTVHYTPPNSGMQTAASASATSPWVDPLEALASDNVYASGTYAGGA